MQRHTLATATTLAFLLLFASTGAALGTQLHADDATATNPNITDVTVRNDTGGFLDDLGFFSFIQGPDSVEPGATYEASVEVDASWVNGGTETNIMNYIQAGEARIILEVYDCNDLGCDDPNQDEFLTAKRTLLNINIYNGEDYTAEFSYQVPSTAEGPHAVTAYMWVEKFGSDGVDNDDDNMVDEGDGSERKISGSPRKVFDVVSSSGSGGSDGDSGSSGSDGSSGGDSAEVRVRSYRQPQITVTENRVQATVYLENTGSTGMDQSNIVELQLRPAGSNPLSWASGILPRQAMSWVTGQQVCDPSHQENVHKAYKLDAGDQRQITLSAPAPGTDTTYSVYVLTRTACADNRDGAGRVEPYPYAYSAGTVCVGTCNTSSGLPVNVVLAAAGGLILAGYMGVKLRG
ncbi:MAG: hypothetical protein SVU32_03900 [Candidatus Nanohaloarchaea archaeon]|nr:hypothetical protein [Candidatus Nanohaloarchaea archaeon]